MTHEPQNQFFVRSGAQGKFLLQVEKKGNFSSHSLLNILLELGRFENDKLMSAPAQIMQLFPSFQ